MNYETGIEFGGMRKDEYQPMIDALRDLSEGDVKMVGCALVGMMFGVRPLGDFFMSVDTDFNVIATHHRGNKGKETVTGSLKDFSVVVAVVDLLTPHLKG